jgi:putative membrane protein
MSQMTKKTKEPLEATLAGVKLPMDTNTTLAFERTNLAHDRTMMAWVRTATALISFGFTIYKFFELEKGSFLEIHQQVLGPRHFAMIMIFIGILSLVMATIEHRQHLVSMRKLNIKMRPSLSAMVAGFISLLGLLAMAAVIFRL